MLSSVHMAEQTNVEAAVARAVAECGGSSVQSEPCLAPHPAQPRTASCPTVLHVCFADGKRVRCSAAAEIAEACLNIATSAPGDEAVLLRLEVIQTSLTAAVGSHVAGACMSRVSRRRSACSFNQRSGRHLAPVGPREHNAPSFMCLHILLPTRSSGSSRQSLSAARLPFCHSPRRPGQRANRHRRATDRFVG